MSSAGPQHAGGNQGNGSQPSGRGLRSLPGFTVAAVVFVLIVLLGVGGIAIANWNQSATVSIAVTAGAAATTSPPPTTAPPTPTPTQTVPPTGVGNIVPISGSFSRPGTVDGIVSCTVSGQSGNFTIVWPSEGTPGVEYVVSVKSVAPAPAFATMTTVPSPTAFIDLNGKLQGTYLLRIQVMKGTSAGDPIYRQLRHGGKYNSGCDEGNPVGQPPLGAFTVSAAPGSPAAGSNILQLNFSQSQATSYLVSIESATTGQGVTKARYGAEFTVTSRQATLTFPPRVTGPNGSDTNADYYGNYNLRVMPLKSNGDGTVTAGDPVKKVIRYQSNDFSLGDS